MTPEYETEVNADGSFSLSGGGPMRPIVVEGDTYQLAKMNWMAVYGRQYEEQERHTALAIAWENRKGNPKTRGGGTQ